MRNMKRIVASLLVAILCLSMIPALAAPQTQGTIVVTTVDAVTGQPIQDATYKLERLTAGIYQDAGEAYTDSSGKAVFTTSVAGWYRVTQTSVAATHSLNPTPAVRYLNASTASQSVTVRNTAKNALYIYRIDPASNAPLGGARYEVKDNNNHVVASGVTQDDGFLIISPLDPGEYSVTETTAPAHYTDYMKTQNIRLTASDTSPFVLVFAGYSKNSITVLNLDGASGEPIEGAQFDITPAGSTVSQTVVTNAAGLAVLNDLEPNTYIIKEKVVGQGYVNDLKSATVTIDEGANAVVVIKNLKPATVSIHAAVTESSTPLTGMKFTLYDQNNTIVGSAITSDSQGNAQFTDLMDGNYTVTAEAPSGYVMSTHYEMVSISSGKYAELIFTATQKGSLQLVSLDEADGKRLAGTTLRVSKMNGTLVGEYTTGSDGTTTLSGLEDGYYIVEELYAPDGYVLVEASHTVRVTRGTTTPVQFYQTVKPFILVESMIEGTRTPVGNCFFEVRNEAGVRVGFGTTGEDGTTIFKDLQPGVYTVNFNNAPEGYTIETASVTVTVTSVKAGLARFTVSKHSAILVTKRDASTSELLPDAIYQIRSELGTPMGSYATGADGTFVTDTLAPGKYYVQELYAPSGYVPSTTSRLVTVVNNKTTLETFTNAKKSAVVIYAEDQSGNPLVDVPFRVFNAVDGLELGQVTTNSAGVATLESVAPGQYVVEETTIPTSYVLVTPVQSRVLVRAGAAAAAHFTHTPKSVILMQTADADGGAPLAGATYLITNAAGDFTGNYEADENGEALTPVLKQGTYYVKQITAPSGYLLDTTTHTLIVSSDSVNLAKFFNKKMTGIVLEAVSQHDHQPLAGCVYEIYNEQGIQVFHGTTDESGLLSTGDLTPGKYTIKQLGQPGNYKAVQPLRTVTVTTVEPMAVVFENAVMKSLYIELIDGASREQLEGGKFRIELIGGDYVSDIVTNAAGIVLAEDLPVGKYMVHETAAPTGYLLSGTYQWAEVKSDSDAKLTFTNERISGLVLQALTLSGHQPLAGAVFEVYSLNNKLVGTFTTDATGVVQVPGLESGTYIIKEVKAPDSYSIQTATQRVTVSARDYNTLNFYHTAHSALTINKKDGLGKPVENAAYRVTKANGDYVGDYKTNSSGQIIIDDLAPGDYLVYETSVPSGYVLDTSPRRMTIKDEQAAVLDFTNDRVFGLTILNTSKATGDPLQGNRFKISKLDGTLVGNYTTDMNGRISVELVPGSYVVYQTYVGDGVIRSMETFNVSVLANQQTYLEVENEVVSGIRVRFVEAKSRNGIYNVRLEVLDGKNNRIGEYRSDNQGYVELSAVLKAGSYKLRILSVPAGYGMDTVVKTIKINTSATTEVIWELNGQEGQIRITTYAGSDSAAMNVRKNSKLSGAEYQILDATGALIRTVVGDSTGLAYSGSLPIGTYYIQQTKAPAGFLVNASRVTVNVTSKNKDVKIDVYNIAGSYELSVNVGGTATGYAASTTKFFFSNIRASGTTAMSDFYLHFKIPTDALRAGTLYTGTWNFAAAYSIQYKTNLRDYTTLVSGLNSKSQYSYDMSTTALGLSNNEYVTDIRFVFPTVPAGFHESITPSIYCSILATVPTGYQYTLRAEVGGRIDGMYHTAAGQYSGLAINNLIFYPLPQLLPKTGY